MHASHSGGAFALAYRPMPSGLRPVPVHAPKALPMPAGVALASAPKPAVHARAPVPVRGAATTLGRPVYDEERYGLVIPYQGQLPLYRWDRRADTAASLEIKGAIATVGRLTQSFSRHPVMSRWQLARNKTAGTVRLDLGFSHPADVVIAADTSRHQLLLIPQPRLAEGVVTSPATATTTLEAARLPMDGRHLFIPFDGPVPAYTLTRVGPTFAYVDFPAGRLASRAVQFFAPEFHPTLAYWLLHERPDHGVRLALALAGDGGAAVYQDRTHQRLVIELGTDGPALGARTAPTLPAPWPGEEREPVLGRK